MAITINITELTNFSDQEKAHFEKSAKLLQMAVNHPDFIPRVLAAPYKEAFFQPAGGSRVSKTPAEIADIIVQGLERGTIADGIIDIGIRKDATLKKPVVGSTAVGKIPFRTSAWFVEQSTETGDTIQPARHMIHEWLHVAGFVHKRNNGYRKDVAYLVGDIVRTILKTAQAQKSESGIIEDADLAAQFDESLDHVDDE